MIKLPKYIGTIILPLLGCCMNLMAYAAPKEAAPILDLSAFVQQQRALIAQQVQQQKDKIKEIESRGLPSIESETESSPSTKEKEQAPDTSQKNAQTSVCDCDNPDDPYNYSSNFLYDADQKKVSRIRPPCQCKVRDSSASSPLIVAPITGEKPSENDSKTIQWNIQY